jgi:hypothetical protein
MKNDSLFSSMVRSGRTTYFIDVKEAKNGRKFISITESTLDVAERRQRSIIRVFNDSITQFRQAVDEAATAATE